MKALVFERNLPRFAAARVASGLGSGRGATVGPLRLTEAEPPPVPGAAWQRVRPLLAGICGSDLHTVDGRSSRYFEDLVSFPFVPGHEVVGVLEGPARAADGSSLEAGARVVLEPVLGCRARAVEPSCPACASGMVGNCERVTTGHLRPGLQIGFCADTGGGWSAAGLVAHTSQLHAVPESLSDEDAVLVEPLACGLHAALRGEPHQDGIVAVLGAGTLGLSVVAALRFLADAGLRTRASQLLVGARYPHQRRVASRLGATTVVPAERLSRAVRRESGSLTLDGSARARRLTGGADVVYDCVGSPESLAEALAMVRPRGRVVMVGMPGRMHIDLAPLWQREVELAGAYAYGMEAGVGEGRSGGRGRPTFELALELAAYLADRLGPGALLSATYPLDRFAEALAHAGGAGRRGAVKVAFDLRGERGADSRAVAGSAAGRVRG
jgi:threonine dehydrogenase-like Zn-dependent dehydrogenase